MTSGAPKQPQVTIDEYIATFPRGVQERMRTIRAIVREEAPSGTDAFADELAGSRWGRGRLAVASRRLIRRKIRMRVEEKAARTRSRSR